MSEFGEEVVVGVHSSGIELQEGLNTSLNRNYCANCKRKTHCFVKVDKKTKEAIVHNTCKSADCECKCRTHYACKLCGYLHPYGQKCDRNDELTPDPKYDEHVIGILNSWREYQKGNIKEVVLDGL